MRQPFLQPQLPTGSAQREVLTVSQLNKRTKGLIEAKIGTIWLEGEISNFIQAASGHWYFSLKDSNAQIKCAIFKFKNRLINLSPKEGDKVIVKGKISLYEARGDYQMIADYMEPSGLGKLQQELNALIKKLDAQQLFSEDRKKEIPLLPRGIGVITSPSGAAIRDVLSVLKRRCPMIPVVIYPSVVQGIEAAADLKNAINIAHKHNQCDVLIITRGGGTLEDLWCFNDEQLALVISASKIPIVAAIGHEIDITITELVADLRAPTPSVAAELVAPDQQELWQKLDTNFQSLYDGINSTIYQYQSRLNIARLSLRDPEVLISRNRHHLERMSTKFRNIMSTVIQQKRIILDKYKDDLTKFHPRTRILNHQHKLSILSRRLNNIIKNLILKNNSQIQLLAGKLHTLSPLSTLSRGYAIARDRDTQKVITKVTQTSQHQEISIILSDGEIDCLVK